MAYHPLDGDSLCKGLFLLPQELYDEIYDFTFISFTPLSGVRDLSDVDQIRQDYKLMHLDTASRASFARSYYTAKFEMAVHPDDCEGEKLLVWLRIVPEFHREYIKRVVLVLGENGPAHIDDTKSMDLGWSRIPTIKERIAKSLGKDVASKVFTRVGDCGKERSF